MFTAIFTFPQERVMLAKERSVGMYRLSAYLLARMTSDLPLDLILPLVFLVITYLMAVLKPTFTAFSLTLLTVFLSVFASQSSLHGSEKTSTFASVIIVASMLSGGFFIQVRFLDLSSIMSILERKVNTEGSSCRSPFKGLRLDWDGMEVDTMIAMIIGYRILTYAFLRRMKLVTLT
ncbi:hypothetical protein V6N12_031364 [Hibiscus sabdariffa]|uniref:ABC-2 type transporter transmembrane domain-containing protein n=1 Tax=Hibiscus sabdariffa TaxID=183260 RepID=A0ABR2EAV0_9ROSI